METTFFLIIVSGIRFATNGPSKQENSTSGYLKSPSIRDGVHFNKEASQFSELERACLNNSDRELYNYLTKKGDKFNDSESITIGFLGAYGSTQVVLGALPLAVEAVNEDATLLPGIRLNFVAGDIGTNSPSSGLARSKSSLAAQAIKFMTKMRDSGAVAFIGPDEMCFSEALVAAAWNLPMISYQSEKDIPSEVRFLDFQMAMVDSPVIDLSCCLYNVADKNSLSNFDFLLKVYHESLSKTMKSLGSNPERILSMSDLKQHWKRYGFYAVMASSCIMKAQLCDPDEMSTIIGLMGEGVSPAKFVSRNIDKMRERVKDAFIHFGELIKQKKL